MKVSPLTQETEEGRRKPQTRALSCPVREWIWGRRKGLLALISKPGKRGKQLSLNQQDVSHLS
jgi:hypothetical protein